MLLLIIIGAARGIGGFFIMAGIIGIFTGAYTLITKRRGWALIPSRAIAGMTLGGAFVVMIVGGAVANIEHPELAARTATPQAIEGVTAEPAPPRPSATPTVPLDPETPVAAPELPAISAKDTTATAGTAIEVLETLPVKGRAPKTGYDRTGMFGTAWLDVDRNGCDTRNDILARDLTVITKSGTCRVLTGTLNDPYTAATIAFTRGATTSAAVQIDHVVALMDAWQKGAQQLSQAQRVAFANDPINLFAVDGPTNSQKRDSDAASWLPPNKAFRCEYVARQVSVKATYGLWVTSAEKDQIQRVLRTCPEQSAFTSSFAPIAPPPAPEPAPPPAPVPAPAPPAPAPEPPAPAPAPPAFGTVHPGAFCSTSGATGVSKKGVPMVCTTTATDDRLRWRSQ